LRVPAGQPIPVEKFSEAVYLAEAAEHGANRCWCSNRNRSPARDNATSYTRQFQARSTVPCVDGLHLSPSSRPPSIANRRGPLINKI
jgi:hypothetical protein